MNEFGCKGTQNFAYMQERERFFKKKSARSTPTKQQTTEGKQQARTKTEGTEVNRPTGGKQPHEKERGLDGCKRQYRTLRKPETSYRGDMTGEG